MSTLLKRIAAVVASAALVASRSSTVDPRWPTIPRSFTPECTATLSSVVENPRRSPRWAGVALG